jgi:transmembrane sensor
LTLCITNKDDKIMNIFNRKKETSNDVLEYIGQHIDKDIERLIKHEKLDYGKMEAPQFDDYNVYMRVMQKIGKSRNTVALQVLKWACVVVLFFGLGYYTYYLSQIEKPQYHQLCAQRGDKLVVLLADGSRVWLNADSHIIYPDHFVGKTREVRITGEAYFEVNKDASHPFIVHSDKMMVKVTGTKFNVKAYNNDDKIFVTLDEGSVRVGESSNQDALKLMHPGQTACYDKNTDQCDVYDNSYYEENSFWKDNKMAFRNSSLEEVLTSLSRRYNVDFKIANPKIYSYTYNIHCNAGNLDEVLWLMETITPIKFHKNGPNRYVVK